jgi:hypothetical protein
MFKALNVSERNTQVNSELARKSTRERERERENFIKKVCS